MRKRSSDTNGERITRLEDIAKFLQVEVVRFSSLKEEGRSFVFVGFKDSPPICEFYIFRKCVSESSLRFNVAHRDVDRTN